VDEIEERLRKWHDHKFGPGRFDTVRTALKGAEEMGELAKAVLKCDWENVEEELADVFFILLHIARQRKVSLLDCARKKLTVIEKRVGIR